jgi:glutathione S-transferase
MLVLHQFPPVWNLPNASPFCWKVENYLRMAGLPYRAQNALPQHSPKKKLPYITDGETVIGDSGLIVDYLKRKCGDPLDADLSREQQALALATRRLVEEHLYFCAVHDRWVADANWPLTRAAFFAPLPPGLRQIIARAVRKSMRTQNYRQGIGRHSLDEIYALGIADLTALADLLGDKPFFLGAQPTSLDATTYAFIGNVLWAPIDSPLSRHARATDNLVAYCDRMKARYWG